MTHPPPAPGPPTPCRRVPKTGAVFKYLRAVAQREPQARERLIQARGGVPAGRGAGPAAGHRKGLHWEARPWPTRSTRMHWFKPVVAFIWSYTKNAAKPMPTLCLPCPPTLQLCARVMSEPDRSAKSLAMKGEVRG